LGKFIKKMISLLEMYEQESQKIDPSKVILFSDMDGVVADFDSYYKEITGISTDSKIFQDKDMSFEILNNALDRKGMTYRDFFSQFPPIKDYKQYWSYLTSLNRPVYLLTAPTRDPLSKDGKKDWAQKYLSNYKNIFFFPSYQKQKIMDIYFKLPKDSSSRKNLILIDDREGNIKNWKKAGGTGILHTSASDTISQLKKLGL